VTFYNLPLLFLFFPKKPENWNAGYFDFLGADVTFYNLFLQVVTEAMMLQGLQVFCCCCCSAAALLAAAHLLLLFTAALLLLQGLQRLQGHKGMQGMQGEYVYIEQTTLQDLQGLQGRQGLQAAVECNGTHSIGT
jgi:hypothetical protein